MILKILLVDDHSMFRNCLAQMLDGQPHLKVVSQADDGRQAVRFMKDCDVSSIPDVVVIDFSMRDLCGADATRQILTLRPTTHILTLSAHDDCAFVTTMFDAGCQGYICKYDSLAELIYAIGEVAAGRNYVSKAIAQISLRI